MNISEELDGLINRKLDAEEDMKLAMDNDDEANRLIAIYAEEHSHTGDEIKAFIEHMRKARE